MGNWGADRKLAGLVETKRYLRRLNLVSLALGSQSVRDTQARPELVTLVLSHQKPHHQLHQYHHHQLHQHHNPPLCNLLCASSIVGSRTTARIVEDVKNSALTTTAASARKKTSTSGNTPVLYATVKYLSNIKWPNGLSNGNRPEHCGHIWPQW